jgi:hypothetical protein
VKSIGVCLLKKCNDEIMEVGAVEEPFPFKIRPFIAYSYQFFFLKPITLPSEGPPIVTINENT